METAEVCFLDSGMSANNSLNHLISLPAKSKATKDSVVELAVHDCLADFKILQLQLR